MFVVGDDAAVATAHNRRFTRVPADATAAWRPAPRDLVAVERGDAAQPQLADEAVLQRLPEALDAAFGLRRAGGDEPDAELAQDAAEVRGVLGAAQLLLEGPVRIVADKDVEAIAIEGQGPAV